MAQPKRRMSKAGIAAIACLSVSFSTLSPVGLAHADSAYTKGVQPTNGAKQAYAADDDALRWGINEMFRGKATSFRAADGARYDVESQKFVFPYVSKDDATKTVDYTGSVTILGDCADVAAPARGTCNVDVTITDPSVTVDRDGKSSISATVHSTKDGVEWFGPEKVELASLDFSAARFNNTDKDTTWVDVAATATDEAADKVFLGTGAVEALAFTYPGKTAEVPGSPLSIEDYSKAVSKHDSSSRQRNFQFDDGSVLQLQNSYRNVTSVLYDASHNKVSDPQAATVDPGFNIAVDPETKTLYWIDVDNVVHEGHVDDNGAIVSTKEITRFTEPLKAMGFDRRPDGTIGILFIPRWQNENRYFRFVEVDKDGNQTETKLPPSADIRPDIIKGEYYRDHAYGTEYDDINGVFALPDGTWLYQKDSEISPPYDPFTDAEEPKGVGARPLHITPNEPVKAKEFKGVDAQFKEHRYVQGVVVHNDIVVMYGGYPVDTKSAKQTHPSLGIYRYEGDTLKQIYANHDADEFAVIGGAAVSDDAVYVLNAVDKKVVKLSLADGSPIGSADIATDKNYFANGANYSSTNLLVSGPNLLAVVPADAGDNATGSQLAAVNEGKTGIVADSAVERVTVGTYVPLVADVAKVSYGEEPLAVTVNKSGNVAPTVKGDTGAADLTATYAFEGSAPEGASIDKHTGVVTYAPTKAKKDAETAKVRVTFAADGSSQVVDVALKAASAKLTVKYSSAKVKVGEKATLSPTLTDENSAVVSSAPEGTTFRFATGEKYPDAAQLGYSLDKNTGVVSFTPTDAQAGKSFDVYVYLVNPDGTESDQPAQGTFTVAAKPTPTSTSTPVPTPTSTPSPTSTSTPVPTSTPTPEPSPGSSESGSTAGATSGLVAALVSAGALLGVFALLFQVLQIPLPGGIQLPPLPGFLRR